MNVIKLTLTFLTLIGFVSCNPGPEVKKLPEAETEEKRVENDKIKVLNFGTFHMGFTTDANMVDFNEHNQKNKEAVHEIAKKYLHSILQLSS